MKLCSACDRHLFGAASTCPFCGADQAMTEAHASGLAMTSVGLALVLGTAACGPRVPEVEPDPGNETSTSTTATSTTAATATTLPGSGTASTTIESSWDDLDAEDDAAGAFYAGPPGDVSPMIACDVVKQNCPADEKCAPWANDGGPWQNAARCVPLAVDAVGPGEPCEVVGWSASGIDDCARGSVCLGTDFFTMQGGECVALCADASTCDANQRCVGIEPSPDVLRLCLDPCDPLAAPDTCGGGRGVCIPVAEELLCFWNNVNGFPWDPGDPCEFASDCVYGSACIPTELLPGCLIENPWCCSPYCDLTTEITSCPDGQTCTPWFAEGDAPEGLERLGVCTIPGE